MARKYGAIFIAAALSAAVTVRPGLCAAPLQDKTYEHLKVLVDMLGYIQSQYVDAPDSQKLIYGAAEGMVDTLDPFSQFLDPESNEDMKSETEGQFGGVGVKVVYKDDWLTVLTPMPGTPAYRAGLLPGDRITAINGRGTKDMSLEDAFKDLRGDPGTVVNLTVARSEGEDEKGPWTSADYPLKREIIKIDSVDSKMIAPGIGYARIAEFSAKTAPDLKIALADLQSLGMKALVLDLRNNPGGLLNAGVDVASYFIGGNRIIVYTQGRDPQSRENFHSQATAPYPNLPLVVLVNGGTASAAEIVSGSLQDYHRAVIIGKRTYGKFSVQSVIPLGDGSALRLTVARYYTPLGRCLARDDDKNVRGGIMPDIVVPISKGDESKLYAQWDMIYAKDKKPRPAARKGDIAKDETLDRAIELLKANEIFSSARAG
ncbi:MAG: S41 family peptidase [Elusimicrobiota bacterium]